MRSAIWSYVRAQLAEASFEAPLDRLAHEAVAGATATFRGKGVEVVNAAVRTALRETVFRFDLVMRIIVTTHELADRQQLLDAIVAADLGYLASMDHKDRAHDPTYRERLASRRDLMLSRVDELLAAQEARETVEARYLGGHPALFPDALREWAEQVRSSQRIAALAVGVAERDGMPLPEPPDAEAVAARTAQLVADLVEPAKVTALEKLGDGQHAMVIAAGWVRGKLTASASKVSAR